MGPSLFVILVSGIMFLFVTLALIMVPIWLLVRERNFFKTAVLVKGIVKDFNSDNSSRRNGRVVYAPIVQYEYNGQIGEVKGSAYSSSIPVIGTEVLVGVNPNNPKDARLKQSDSTIKILVIVVLIFVGALFPSLLGVDIAAFCLISNVELKVNMHFIEQIIFGFIIFTVGICFLWLFIKKKLFFMKAIFVQGVVVGASRNGKKYIPIVQFEYKGQIRQIQGGNSSKMPIDGQPMLVGINPNNIHDARVETKGCEFTPFLLTIIGLCIMLACIYKAFFGS